MCFSVRAYYTLGLHSVYSVALYSVDCTVEEELLVYEKNFQTSAS